MPIVFEQPGPVGSGAAARYGAAQQYEKDREFALREAALVNQANRGGGGGGGGGGGESFELDRIYESARQANLQEAGRNSRMQTATEAGFAEAEMKFTYADNIRLQQLEQGRASVRQQLDSGVITQEESQELLGYINGGASMLEAAKGKQEMKHRERQNAILQEQAMHRSAQENTRTRILNKTMPERTHAITLDDGTTARVIQNPDGSVTELRPPAGGGRDPNAITTANRQHAVDAVRNEIRLRRTEAANPLYTGPAFTEPTLAEQQTMVSDYLQLLQGNSQAGQPTAGMNRWMREAMESGPTQPSSASGGRGPQQVAPIPQDISLEQIARLPPQQRHTMQGLINLRSEINMQNLPLTTVQRTHLSQDVDRVQDIYQRAPHASAMSEDDQREVHRLMSRVRTVLEEARTARRTGHMTRPLPRTADPQPPPPSIRMQPAPTGPFPRTS